MTLNDAILGSLEAWASGFGGPLPSFAFGPAARLRSLFVAGCGWCFGYAVLRFAFPLLAVLSFTSAMPLKQQLPAPCTIRNVNFKSACMKARR